MKGIGANRAFGLLITAGFLLLAALAYSRNKSSVMIWAVLAASFFLLALALPRVLAPLRRAWIRLSQLLGRVTNPLILGIVYVAVLIPVGTLMRLFGRDPMARVPDPVAQSYWVMRTVGSPGADGLKEQF